MFQNVEYNKMTENYVNEKYIILVPVALQFFRIAFEKKTNKKTCTSIQIFKQYKDRNFNKNLKYLGQIKENHEKKIALHEINETRLNQNNSTLNILYSFSQSARFGSRQNSGLRTPI